MTERKLNDNEVEVVTEDINKELKTRKRGFGLDKISDQTFTKIMIVGTAVIATVAVSKIITFDKK